MPVSEPLYEAFCTALRDRGADVQTGVFGGAHGVSLVNDGPVTILLDTDGLNPSQHEPEANLREISQSWLDFSPTGLCWHTGRDPGPRPERWMNDASMPPDGSSSDATSGLSDAGDPDLHVGLDRAPL